MVQVWGGIYGTTQYQFFNFLFELCVVHRQHGLTSENRQHGLTSENE